MVSPHFAISAIFLLNGFVLANWVARIPAITQQLQLDNAQFGTALLGMAVGALFAFPVTGNLIARFGSARITAMFGLAFGIVIPLLAVAPNFPLLFLALMLFGAGNGGMDVAMNAQGIEVEGRLKKPIISSLHGFFSLGGIVGAASGGIYATFGVEPLVQFALTTALTVTSVLWLQSSLVQEDSATHEKTPAPLFALPPRALWGLGAVAFCAAVGEGAVADWSALYLRESLGTGAGTAALGYAAFSLAMLIGRFLGDTLVTRLGPAGMVRAGGAVASLGLAGGLILNAPGAAIFGFGAVGLGLSIVAPLVFSLAGNHPNIPRGTAVAAVATIGYSGFLAGPLLLGWFAHVSSLRLALGVIVILSVLIIFLSAEVQRMARLSATS